MTLADIISNIEVKDETKEFYQFANKWIQYVISKKESAEISDADWQELFGRSNPVASINWGEMKDELSEGGAQINEQKSFKEGWDKEFRGRIQKAINAKSEEDKIKQIKELSNRINVVLKEGGGRRRDTAINRMLTTFFPELFIKNPQPQLLKEFISLLHQFIENSITIVDADNWIDNSYSVRRYFKEELTDENEQLSAWWVYKYLKNLDASSNKSGTFSTNKAISTDDCSDSNDSDDASVTAEYAEFVKILKVNYNLILTGAPGTGKTYLAKQIAKAMGSDKVHIGFVQFHPSYDYTDFVEGLRPIKKDDNLGFQRKDGVFKKFCKDALKYGNQNIDDAFKAFHSDLSKGRITIKSHKKNSTEFEVELGDKNYKIFINTDNCPKDGYNCSIDAVKRYIETGQYIEGHQTYQPSIGEYIRTTYMKKVFVFIIDEINRGEISKIFGELFYSIDCGYRGKDGMVETQYQNLIPKEGDSDFDPKKPDVFRNGFYVPKNVYIIGTMNDIDRSVESMDFAMRRRFAWKEITAKSRQSMLDEDGAWKPYAKPSQAIIDEIKVRMDNLNAAIIDQYQNETLSYKDKIGLSKAYQIGAAYFLKYALYNDFNELWTNHLEGLLYEYLRGKTNIDEKIDRLHQAYNDTKQH